MAQQKTIKVKIARISEEVELPSKAYEGDSGYDIKTYEAVTIPPNQTEYIQTGLKFDIPDNYEIQVRPRSSFGKSPIRVIFDTIDSSHKGYICITAHNTSKDIVTIPKGVKLAQIVIAPVPRTEFILSDETDFSSSERGSKGLGSSGKDYQKLIIRKI